LGCDDEALKVTAEPPHSKKWQRKILE